MSKNKKDIENEENKENEELYKTLALNDTIHDFGKGNDRGIDINLIVEKMLSIDIWKGYNLMGTPGLFKKGNSFEKGTEKYVLQKYNLPGIPDDMIESNEYFIKSDLGDANAPETVKNIPIIEFINDNNIRNYAIVLTPEQIAQLTDKQKENILETPSNIHSSIDFIATLIVKDVKKLFKARVLYNSSFSLFSSFSISFLFLLIIYVIYIYIMYINLI